RRLGHGPVPRNIGTSAGRPADAAGLVAPAVGVKNKRAALWAPPPFIRAPLAGFAGSVKQKQRTKGAKALRPAAISSVPDLEANGHFLPAFLGRATTRRGPEAPFGQRALLC